MTNPHIQKRLDKKLDKIRSSYSSFWMGDDAEDLMRKVDEDSPEYLHRLRSIQRGIGNFVRIVTGKDIPVVYSSGRESFTDGKTVVLSASTDPTKLDSMVGIALHEGTHCLLSNQSLRFLPQMQTYFDKLLPMMPSLVANAKRLGIPLTENGVTSGPALGKSNDTVFGHIMMMMNVLEDRRIDLWMYQNAIGYQPYYDSMYDEYWHSPSIDKMLQEPKYWDRSVHAYFIFTINMTNQYFNAQAMPGLDMIRSIANLTEAGLMARDDDDPKWTTWRTKLTYALTSKAAGVTPALRDEMPLLFIDAVKMLEVIYENATSIEMQQKPNQSKDQQDGEGDSSAGGDLVNYDNMPTPQQLKEIKEALDRQIKFIKHELDKQKISNTTAQQLEQLQATNASYTEVAGDFLPPRIKAPVIIYRDIKKKDVENPMFPFATHHRSMYGASSNMKQALIDGLRKGTILANRIRVMQDEKPLTFNRQEHGKLDKRRVHALGTGADDVFSFTIIERKKPVNVWIDIDFSGSMSGIKAQNAMMVAVAIAQAAHLTRTLNCTISVRDGDNGQARVAIIYDSRKHHIRQLREIVPLLSVNGGTPESLAFESIKEEILKSYGNERKYFINLSDGEPAHSVIYKGKGYSYGGEPAYRHTRQLMREFRNAGIKVLSYFIEHSRGGPSHNSHFKQMYGEDARFIDPTNIGQIAATLNKLLMDENQP